MWKPEQKWSLLFYHSPLVQKPMHICFCSLFECSQDGSVPHRYQYGASLGGPPWLRLRWARAFFLFRTNSWRRIFTSVLATAPRAEKMEPLTPQTHPVKTNPTTTSQSESNCMQIWTECCENIQRLVLKWCFSPLGFMCAAQYQLMPASTAWMMSPLINPKCKINLLLFCSYESNT